MKAIIIYTIILFVAMATPAWSATYWVHPTDNTATWNAEGCQAESDPGAGKYCSLTLANANLAAGDTAYLKGGTYLGLSVQPTNSGSSGSMITFEAASGETPIIKHNLVPNWDMELDSGWTSVGTPTSNIRAEDEAPFGTYSRKFVVDAAGEGIESDTFTMSAGVSYNVTFWVKSDQTSVNIKTKDGGGGSWYDNNSSITENVWNFRSVLLGSDSAGSSASISFLSPASVSSGTYYIEDVMITPYVKWGLQLYGKNYIKVSGITFTQTYGLMGLFYGSSFNEIENCVFDRDAGTNYTSSGINSWYPPSTAVGYSALPPRQNWIHGCTFSRAGRMYGPYVDGQYSCNDQASSLVIGTTDSPWNSDRSNRNLIEDNTFYYCGHDCITNNSAMNTIRNNVVMNPESYWQDLWENCQAGAPESGYFGNRLIITEDVAYLAQGYSLYEGNRAGYSGKAPDQAAANGFELDSIYNIIRYNAIFDNGLAGYYAKTQAGTLEDSDYNRIYNNSFFHNGYDPGLVHNGASLSFDCNGVDRPAGNVFKNNIFYDHPELYAQSGSNCYDPSVVNINYFTDDPKYTDTTLTNKLSTTLPDLRLQSSSSAIDMPAEHDYGALTLASGAGTDNTTLRVDDATYFQDGTWAPTGKMSADHIAIGTVGNTVAISKIYWLLTLGAAPSEDWGVGDVLTGDWSGTTCTVVQKISDTSYEVSDLSGPYRHAEPITSDKSVAASNTGASTFTLTLDVAPETTWSVSDTITGVTSGATCIVSGVTSSTVYTVHTYSQTPFTRGEVLTNGTYTADQGSSYPAMSTIDYFPKIVYSGGILLSEAKSWQDDAPIWLYKKSDGERVLYGSAPDYGAYEYNSEASPTASHFGGSGSFNMR